MITKTLKRLLFVILLLPFVIACALIMGASLFYWLFTGKELLFIIDYLKIQMERLLR